jgi:hypothetical protein
MRPYLDQWGRATSLVLFCSALALAGCQSPPPPTAAMERARTAIEGAQLDGAQQLTPAQLQTAQETLAGAQQAVGRKDMDGAKYLAEEAEMQGILADQAALAQKATNAQAALARAQPALESVPMTAPTPQTPRTPRRQRQQTQ